ncbi:RES family NAD+ phosphorylase [Mesorhizobium sp. ANAO-SY3R2]|uniref:RES family NAD+ phosphorylase n=1 Tax=Mesorhizobium sp. ANAO-SY3R2 TaxID=3166644 RepID=UPI00366F7372
MRFTATCFRAHDPRWSFLPLSGEGAAIRGARFNPKGVPALYLALGVMTAVKEANQGFAHRIDPCVLCSYEVDCDDIVDLRTSEGSDAAGISSDDMACGWMGLLADGQRPPSWAIHDRLVADGAAGILVPSFAPGADAGDHNLVLWHWAAVRPYKVTVIDPSGRLPKNQLSWG